jgi:aminoglycoside phosphotransferase (APT) family kinase protein
VKPARAHNLSAQGQALAALVQRLAPGAHLIRTRRLRGGLGPRMDLLSIQRDDGTPYQVCLRRFVNPHRFSTPEHVTHEFANLRLAEAGGIPAPRPILLDVEGQYFGAPMIVLSYLPGRPLFPSKNIGPWVDALAGALHMVHAVTPDRFDLSALNVYLRDGMRERIRTDTFRFEQLAVNTHAVLESDLDRIDFSTPTLVHDDFWPGNTIWYRGRFQGIIDWTTAELGDPRADVAQCRVDLIISHGVDVAGAFREAYERRAGRSLDDLWYFDLFRGVKALAQYEQWLKGYHDLGLLHLLPAEVGARLRSFLSRALDDRERRLDLPNPGPAPPPSAPSGAAR